jgi:hypothetical protein
MELLFIFNQDEPLQFKDVFGFALAFALGLPNGLRYLRVGGRGFALGAEKTRSEENA